MRPLLLALTGLLLVGAAHARTADEAALLRTIKKAEQAGFERHQLKRYLEAFAPTCTWTIGRREKPGEYDTVVPYADHVAQQTERFELPVAGKDRVYLQDEKVTIEGDDGTVRARVARHFFGGSDEWMRVYTAKKSAKGAWHVTAVRAWPLRESIGPQTILFDDAFWTYADKMVEEQLEADNATFESRMVALVQARRFAEAHALTVKASEGSKDPLIWTARAEAAFEIGKLDDALAAARKARQLDPAVSLPFFARPGR
ncbi:MAG: hypothetical protein H6704_11665 [Myxococcales bacterium]|nr:hypothetical protein [Myxococcales bacterium]